MKIAYNPIGGAALTVSPPENDITFDLPGQAIWVKGVRFGKYETFLKHTSTSGGGKDGLVPAPNYTETAVRFLREDGKWFTPVNTDTKNTAGATNSASKMYLIGATSQGANPQTYSNSNIYATNGDLVANSFQGSIKGVSVQDVNTAYKDLHFKFYNNVTGCDSTVSTDGKRYAGTDNSFGFPVSNNANSMLWLGAHSGNYGHQLGFSSDGRIYDRCISNGSFPTTVNGGSWKKLAYTNDNFLSTQIKIDSNYKKAEKALNIVVNDSANDALSKLEYKTDIAYNWITSVTSTDTDQYINKWGEIVEFLKDVKDTTHILEEFVTTKTPQTITGIKTFAPNGGHSLHIRSYTSDYVYSNLENTQKWVSLGMTCIVPTKVDGETTVEEHTGYFVYEGNTNYYLTNSGWYNKYLILHTGNYSNYLPYLNNARATNTSTIYAPTTGGDAGQILKSNGSTNAPTWVNPSTITVGSLLGGTAGSLVYQSEANKTSFLSGVTTDNCILKYDVSTNQPYWAYENSLVIWDKQFDEVTLSTEWQDLFNFKNSGFTSGTYCIQLYIRQTTYGFFNCYYSGIMSLYMTTHVNDLESNSEEILLHYSGHHTNYRIYLRLKTKPGTNDYPILQISCSQNLGTISTSDSANQFFIKLKQLI